ncbi:glycoside hydrolase family 25 protein [Novosphingobium fuchskuhlense]|uniref:glycoside hydrolase family 25 protein n=1 Tax=Novosphingobium fuchskuhlense TaxID=1117702 RepID=UPI0009E6E5D7|nr:glycoside hydrolase family 25 protein [Novosphingobium fuchskuhlense]
MSKPGKPARRRVWILWAVLLIAGAAAFVWWESRRWEPDRNRFPVQGAWLDAHDGAADWSMLKAHGADFVYLSASEGAGRRDEAFDSGLAAARKAGLQLGAVHVYDLCAPADAQAANFVTVVPRDDALLPPAVALDLDSRSCPEPPGEAAMQSELTTFLNQIEKHTERPAILMISRTFEAHYHLAARIDRNLWVAGDFLDPSYTGRPWVMWTATSRLRIAGLAGPVRWVAVHR